MAQEIERKFLVLNDLYKSAASRSFRIRQGYLSSNPERTVRVRIKGDSGFLTVKGGSDPTGISRYEWEKMIPVNEAEELLRICEPGMIDKVRFEIKFGNHIFEVDEFLGENLGLVVAELELKSEDESYLQSDWLGREVTGELKYYNSQLARRPYNLW
ncbi:MAG TPA: CYTH domain-containing protein [Prolixibacteraceae bacterium]